MPDGLDDMAPGPALAVVLATIDRTRLGGSDTVSVLAARARQVAYEQAQLLADLEEVSRTDWHTGPHTLTRMSAADEFSVDQIGWALRWSNEAAKAQLAVAVDLLHRLPAVYAALVTGRIDLPRARVFHEALLDCADEVARRIVDRLIEPAADWTCGTLRERLRYQLHKHDPGWAARRYRRAVTPVGTAANDAAPTPSTPARAATPAARTTAAPTPSTLARAATPAERRRATPTPSTPAACTLQPPAIGKVSAPTGRASPGHQAPPPCWPVPVDRGLPSAAGTPATVGLGGDPVDEVEGQRWVPAWAVADPDHPPLGCADLGPGAAPTNPGDPAGPDAADAARVRDEPGAVALDARACCTRGGLRQADRRGVVTVTISLPTLLGLTDQPALIPGWGPVLADIARQIALDRTHPPSWQFAGTDPHGNLLHAGTTRRRPSAAAIRITRLRARACRAVNCRRPATGCDTDHRRAHASGGCADPTNLDSLCRHHHRLKHDKNLILRHLGHGAYQWQAPC